jgi:hypothetical protein
MNKKTEILLHRLLADLNSSISGDLILPLRRLLWKTMTESYMNAEKKIILTELDALCVRHDLSIWTRKFGSPDDILEILTVATKVASGLMDGVQGLKVRDEYYVEVVENQEYKVDEYPAMFIGHAAANTIVTAVDTFAFDETDLRHDRDLDPEAFEPSFLAAAANAGGLDDSGNTEQRRKFWLWYLTVAVPQVA